MKKIFLGFNWKMNPLSLDEAVDLAEVYKHLEFDKSKMSICFFPPSIYLSYLIKETYSYATLGVQDISSSISGAQTGQISSVMASDLGLKQVIIGHSETREAYRLTNQDLNKKLILSIKENLTPVYCIGYQTSREDKEINYGELKNQVLEGLKSIELTFNNTIYIAYEPVWAIGSGKPATPQVVSEIVNFLRDLFDKEYPDYSSQLKILYGGSINSSNIKDFLEILGLDGFLIGGASLKPEEVKNIVSNCS